MSALKLEIAYDFDFELIGIVSSAPAYQVVWSINNSLNIDLYKHKDIELNFTTKKVVVSNYLFKETYSYIRLFKNQSSEETIVDNKLSLFDERKREFFLPELKKYDFIIQLEGTVNNLHADLIISKLKEIGKIQFVTLIDLNDIKEKDNLIFE